MSRAIAALTVLTCASVLVASLLLARRQDGQSPRPREAVPEARTVSLPVAAPEAAPAAPAPQAPTIDPCAGVRSAIAEMDGARIDVSLDRLIRWIDGDIRRALEVVSLLSRESDACLLDVIADALSQDDRLGEAQELVDAFLTMALRDTLPARRIAALTFLQERPRGEALEANFLSIAFGDADADVRTAAVCAIRRQVDLVPRSRGRLNAVLLRVAASEDFDVRAPAIEALSMAEADDAQVSTVAGYLRDDERPMVRLMAADKLGEVAPERRVQAMRALEDAYVADADDRVRCATLTALVRAGGAEALPALRRIAGKHAVLDPVVERYAAAIAAGRTDLQSVFDEAGGIEESALTMPDSSCGEPSCTWGAEAREVSRGDQGASK